MTDREAIAEIRKRGWDVRLDEDCSPTGSDGKSYQAFFRGFQTTWRPTLAEVLADVKANQETEKTI